MKKPATVFPLVMYKSREINSTSFTMVLLQNHFKDDQSLKLHVNVILIAI